MEATLRGPRIASGSRHSLASEIIKTGLDVHEELACRKLAVELLDKDLKKMFPF